MLQRWRQIQPRLKPGARLPNAGGSQSIYVETAETWCIHNGADAHFGVDVSGRRQQRRQSFNLRLIDKDAFKGRRRRYPVGTAKFHAHQPRRCCVACLPVGCFQQHARTWILGIVTQLDVIGPYINHVRISRGKLRNQLQKVRG